MSRSDITESGSQEEAPLGDKPWCLGVCWGGPTCLPPAGSADPASPGGSAPPSLSSSSVKWDCPSSHGDLHYNECGGSCPWALVWPAFFVGFSAQICGPSAHPSLCSVLQSVLRGLGSVVSVEERSLTGTWDVSEMRRWTWSMRDPHGHRGSGTLVLTPPRVASLTPRQTPALPLRPV